jgi:hypothetical protein
MTEVVPREEWDLMNRGWLEVIVLLRRRLLVSVVVVVVGIGSGIIDYHHPPKVLFSNQNPVDVPEEHE